MRAAVNPRVRAVFGKHTLFATIFSWNELPLHNAPFALLLFKSFTNILTVFAVFKEVVQCANVQLNILFDI